MIPSLILVMSIIRWKMLAPFHYAFVQRGVLEVLLLSIGAGLLGTWIVMRGLAFYSHAVATAAFPGLVLADGLGFSAPLGALAAAALFAVGVERLAAGRRSSYDSLTALVLVGALALGVILASDVFHSGANVETLLFGSLLLIGRGDIVFAAAASAAVLAGSLVLGRRWLATGFDPETAPALGLRSPMPDARTAGSHRAQRRLGACGHRRAPGDSAVRRTRRHGSIADAEIAPLAARLGCARRSRGRRWPLALREDERSSRGSDRGAGRRHLCARRSGARGRAQGEAPAAPRCRCCRDAADLARLRCAAAAAPPRWPRRRRSATGSACSPGPTRRSTRSCNRTPILTSTSLVPRTSLPPPAPRSSSRTATGSTPGWRPSSHRAAATRVRSSWANGCRSSCRASGPGRSLRRTIRTGGTTLATPRGRCGPSAPPWLRWTEPIAGGYQHRTDAYLARLRALDRGIAACFASVPRRERKLVTDHDAFGYFAHRYGIQVVGAVIPSQTTQAQPSAGEIAHLIALIRREHVKAVFPESSLSPRSRETIARETGAVSSIHALRRHARARPARRRDLPGHGARERGRDGARLHRRRARLRDPGIP